MSENIAFLENRSLMLRIKEWLIKNPQFVMLGVGVRNNLEITGWFPAILIDSSVNIPNNQRFSPINHVMNRAGHNHKGIYFVQKEDFELYKDIITSKKFYPPVLLQELINAETLIKRTIQL